jgi:hypothetical protein
MADIFDRHSIGLSDPPEDGAAVTPSDADDLDTACRYLWIGTPAGGALRVTTTKGTVLNFAGVQAGLFPIRARRVHATGTSVADIVALW